LEPIYEVSVVKDSDDNVVGDEIQKFALPAILDEEGDPITM
jgi:hypothetical protein